MKTRLNRRRFLTTVAATTVAGSKGLQWGHACAADNPGLAGKRVFVAAFAHETNTFHPLRTTSYSVIESKPGATTAVPGVKEGGLVGIAGTSAYPNGGGTIDGPACRGAMDRIVESLRAAMPVDALFLQLHGAMYADGVGPAETVLVERLRAVIGPKVPIACTFDLHGNIPARLGEAGDILVGFKTAPHIDQRQTAEHAGRLLVDALLGKIHPVSYVLPIPMILPGEKAMTTAEPFRSLVAEARRVESQGVPGHAAKILAATIFVGCAWTDSYDTGMSVMVTADGSKAAARAAATHLARQVWDARRQFAFGCETAELEQGVAQAMAAKQSTVFLTDSGDNVTASTPGDLPVVLRHLIDHKIPSAVVAGIFDEAATRRCFEAGEGKRLRLSIGATVEKRYGPPLDVEAEVVRLIPKGVRMAVVRAGGVEVILTEQVVAFTDPHQFQACGIDPLSRKIVVVKEGYLYPKLSQIAPRHIMLLTPGTGDMRIEKLKYVRRRKPLFPLESDARFEL